MYLCRSLFSATRATGLALVLTLFACQDSTGPSPDGPALAIVEARTGGNPDAFVYTPLAENPTPDDPDFDAGQSHELLRPYLRVCATDEASCLTDVTFDVTGSDIGLAMTYDATDEVYRTNLMTSQLDPAVDYRLEVWLAAFGTDDRPEWEAVVFPDTEGDLVGQPRYRALFRDVGNAPSTANCTILDDLCLIKYGQTVVVRVRLEQYVFCPVSRECAYQFVPANVDATLEASFDQGAKGSAQLIIPGQPGTDFNLGFEPCPEADSDAFDAFVDIPVMPGTCLKSFPPPTGGADLTQAALLYYCGLAVDHDAFDGQVVTPEQIDQLKVGHASTGGDGVAEYLEIWPEITPACGTPTSGGLASADPSGVLSRLAGAGRSLVSMLGPRPLAAIDRGGGGECDPRRGCLASWYGLVLPAKEDYESPTDASLVAVAGTEVTLRAAVSDLVDDPVKLADVHWAVVASPGDAATVTPDVQTTGDDGISAVTVTLPLEAGTTVIHAFGLGIADIRNSGCTLPGGTPGAASCNGPRAAFDPFAPDGFGPDNVLLIPDGTRITYTIVTCEAKGGRKKCPPGSY